MPGIVIPFDPVAVTLGPISIRWFGLFTLAGFGVALAAAQGAGLPFALVLRLGAWAVPVGVVGARLFHLADGWEFYLEEPEQVLAIGAGGLSLWGGLICGGAVLLRVARRQGLDPARLADRLVAPVLLAEAIGRVGAFLSGDGAGAPATVPWAVVYSHNSTLVPDFDTPRHPVQLYLALFALALATLTRGSRAGQPGRRALLAATLYGAGRAALGLLAEHTPLLLGLSQAQLLGLIVFLVAGGMLAYSLLRRPLAPAPEVA